jgi:lysophospholipase L1-like esterase
MAPVSAALLLVVGLTASLVARWSGPDGSPRPSAAPTGWHEPRLGVPTEVRAGVGERVVVTPMAFDAAGNELDVEVGALPAGASVTAGGEVVWGPEDAVTASLSLSARDTFGLETTREVSLLGRHPVGDDLLVAMGDSVASGHGLQRRDYLGGDRCWRDQESAYPSRLLDGLLESGRFAEDGELALVACSGADVDDLVEDDVTGGPESVELAEASQLEWAVRANPEVITLTVGANDLDFHRPDELVGEDGLDTATLDERLAAMAGELESLLDRLVSATDATVVVTTYHNPVADEPRGIEGCRDRCFGDAVDEASARLNDRIAEVAGGFDDDRVRVADVAAAFEGRGAPRPAGGFALRDVGLGALARVAPVPEITTSAYCADGDGEGRGSWVSGIDCVHPDASGAKAYADAVLEALGA